ncbi:hypothetical protein LLEC1_03956 [Akanthomyces lecanii]|uniref:Phytocyanin domain-containing protein n=1 Tax=Cordyceps confragosa TaxID=2714763 RepID=A0A179IBH3_CORDF|nr:hypothetical protein LLEC1_03956 [Akanthomyces lecanii]
MKWSTSVALAVAPLAMAASNRLRSTNPTSLDARGQAVSELQDHGVTVIETNGGGKAKDGEANYGNAKDGEAKDGNAKDGEAKDGNVQDGEAKDGSAKDGNVKDGNAKDGNAKGGKNRGGVNLEAGSGVGGPGGLSFQPDQLSVPVGDMIVFELYSQNHTVSQSAFKTPCKRLEGGMDSGFLPNPNNTISPPPRVAMQVTTADPSWFYCRQEGHCGKGMTFAVNPTADKTQAMFQAMAIAQNGKNEATPITGGTNKPGGAAPVSPPPANAEQPKAGGTGEEPNSRAGEGSTGGTQGNGTVGPNGSCTCTVECNAGGFPASAQGAGACGGFAGALTMPTTMAAIR